MQIGEPRRVVTVEPLEDPVPREVPLPKEPFDKPDGVPREPEPVPAQRP